MGGSHTTGTTGILAGSLGLGTDGILGPGLLDDLIILIPPPTIILPDDGGVLVTLEGTFPLGQFMIITMVNAGLGIDRECFSGVLGQGNQVWSADGVTIQAVSPPLPLGLYDIVVTPGIGAPAVAIGGAESIHRSFRSPLFGLRAVGAYPRNVGARSIDEDV